jgi:hypothetical protein
LGALGSSRRTSRNTTLPAVSRWVCRR